MSAGYNSSGSGVERLVFIIINIRFRENGTGLRTLIGLERPNGPRYASPGQSEFASDARDLDSHVTEGLKA